MSAEVWGVVVAFAGVGAAFLAVFVAAFFWLATAIQSNGRENREEIRRLREDNKAEIRELRTELRAEIRAEGQERRADMQRFFDALYRHRHEGGGAASLPESAD